MHTVFYVSDGTAITAEVFGHAVLSQFPLVFEQVTIPFVETQEKARQVRARIDEQFRQTGVRPILFHTIVDPRCAKRCSRPRPAATIFSTPS